MSKRGFIEVQLTKCLVVLAEAEFNRLLQKDPEVWEMALRRGKATLRARAAQQRACKKAGIRDDAKRHNDAESMKKQRNLTGGLKNGNGN